MKKLALTLAVIASLFGVVAIAADQPNGTAVGPNLITKTETYTVANSLATNVAALTANSGLRIDRGGAVAVVVGAEATRTLSAGNMRCYVYMPVYEPNLDGGRGVSYAWFPFPSLDFAIVSGNRYMASGDKQSFTGIGRIVWLPDSVTVSAGTTITTTLSVRYGLPQ